MKEKAIVFLIIFVLGAVAWQTVTLPAAAPALPTPVPTPTQAEIAAASDAALRWRVFWWAVVAALSLSAIGASVRFFIVPAWKDYHTYKPDERGMFPMIRTWHKAKDGDGHKVKYESFYDQNASMTPGATVVKNGRVDIQPHGDGDLSLHHDYAKSQLGYLSMRAMSGSGDGGRRGRGMNRAEISLISGEAAARTERERQRARAAQVQTEQRQERLEQWRANHAQTVEVPAIPVQPLSLAEAVQRSTPDSFVVGQSDGGQVARWSLRTAIHGALVGSTGTGKTSSVGMKILVDAIAQKHHTIILDGMGGDDLGVFKPWAEWYDMDAETLPDQIAGLHRLHHARLGGGWDQRIVCVIEEFNDAWESIRDTRATEAHLATLLNKGRHSGIHLLFIAQETRTWPDAVFNGAKARFVFQVGAREAGRLGEWHAQHLPDQGRFIFRGEEFTPWHVAPEVRTLMNTVPVTNVRALLTNGPANVVTNDRSPEVRTVTNADERSSGEGVQNGENTPPIPLVRAFARNRSWDAVGEKFFEIYPDGTQAELSRIMATLADDGRGHTAFKGEAFRIYHSYSPNGDRSKTQ